jgi:hypothetical protein
MEPHAVAGSCMHNCSQDVHLLFASWVPCSSQRMCDCGAPEDIPSCLGVAQAPVHLTDAVGPSAHHTPTAGVCCWAQTWPVAW